MTIKRKVQLITPKQPRSIKTRDRIFRTAVKVFAEKGLYGARIDEIARRARVNKQRIYAFFGSKKRLYRAVLMDVYAKAAANERLVNFSDDDISDMTEIIIDSFFEFHENNAEFWRLLSYENLSGGKGLAAKDWRAVRTNYMQQIESFYKQGQKQGALRKDIDFSVYMMLLLSITYFYFSNQLTVSHLLNLKLSDADARQRIQEQMLKIIARGVTPSPSGK